jgi:hypothetical protein
MRIDDFDGHAKRNEFHLRGRLKFHDTMDCSARIFDQETLLQTELIVRTVPMPFATPATAPFSHTRAL